MTKPLVSTVAMMLVEEGRMKLDDPIAGVLPELRDLKVEVTRDGQTELVAPGPAADHPRPAAAYRRLRLFRRRALAGASSRPTRRTTSRPAREAITGDEMLKRLGTIPLAFQPGTTFFYSIAVDVLGLLVQRVAGKRLDAVLEERLLGPLGMRDTGWFVPEAKRARLAEAPDSDPQKESDVARLSHPER